MGDIIQILEMIGTIEGRIGEIESKYSHFMAKNYYTKKHGGK